MKLYEWLDRALLAPLGPERGHALALLGMSLGIAPRAPRVDDPFLWNGVDFPNRIGVAAGFDKNAVGLRGLAAIGAGFAEIGTILTRPWAGQPLRPRMARLPAERGIWNRLGFPSDGVARIAPRIAHFSGDAFTLGCNIAPHPLTLKTVGEPGFSERVRGELGELIAALHPHARFFVINLSSPNTSGLRGVLHGEGFAQEIVAPVRERLRALSKRALDDRPNAAREAQAAERRASGAGRAQRGEGERRVARTGNAQPPLLLVKLPPEDAARAPWRAETLRALVGPLAHPEICDGFVAVNTSISLALAKSRFAQPDAPGGVSGAPLFAHSLGAMRALSELAHPQQLRIGVGGVMTPENAVELARAGAQLVELYSGMIYRGPSLIRECAEALKSASPALL